MLSKAERDELRWLGDKEWAFLLKSKSGRVSVRVNDLFDHIDALETQLAQRDAVIKILRDGIEAAGCQSTAPNVFRVLNAAMDAADAKEGEGK